MGRGGSPKPRKAYTQLWQKSEESDDGDDYDYIRLKVVGAYFQRSPHRTSKHALSMSSHTVPQSQQFPFLSEDRKKPRLQETFPFSKNNSNSFSKGSFL